MRPLTARTDRFAWGAQSSMTGTGTGFITAPATGRDAGFRTFAEHIPGYDDPPFFADYQVVGTFDPRKLTGALDPGVSPLSPFHPADVPAADPSAARWLGGQDLAPDGNMAGYLSSPTAGASSSTTAT